MGVGSSGISYVPNNVGRVLDTTEVNLLNGNTYTTSEWIDVTQLGSVAVRAYASHSGHFSVLFSSNGVDTHSTIGPYYYDPTLVFTPKILAVGAGYCKITFTNNSGSNQTNFLFELIGSPVDKLVKVGRNRTLPLDVDCIPVRFANELDIMCGRVEREYILGIGGFNLDVDGAEDIWDGGGDYTGFPTSTPEAVEVRSDSVNDTNAAGTGARKVRMYYYNGDGEMFDSSGNFLTTDIDLNGSTWVNTGIIAYRVWKLEVIESGSNTTNIGTITARWVTTTANIFVAILPGYGESQISAVTIPLGYTGYLKRYSASMNDTSANTANMVIKVRDYGTGTFRFLRPFSISTDAYFDRDPYGGLKLEELTDIVMRCTSIANVNGIIEVNYSIHLVKNTP